VIEMRTPCSFRGSLGVDITKMSGGRCIGPLKVLDIRDRQWENKNYEVSDYGDVCISFCCRAYSVREQEPAAPNVS
jgi:hypothetical protein